MTAVDVAVVGAGPAGIAAAIAAAGSGAETLLIDENDSPGGQLRWRLGASLSGDFGLGTDPAPGPEVARHLAERLASTDKLTVSPGTIAWGLFEDNLLGISGAGGASEVRADAVVLTTGSTDITYPFPGWTLPGVMTARAVQIFMHIHRVLPGHRWAILGDTAEGAELAGEIEQAGGEVVARLSDHDAIRASGTNRLAHVEQDDDVYEVDGLAVALGRQPDPELALQAMAESRFDWDLGGYIPYRDEHGATSVPGLYVAGDAAGIGDLREIVTEGRIAGLAAAGAKPDVLRDARDTLEQISTERRRAALARIHLDQIPT